MSSLLLASPAASTATMPEPRSRKQCPCCHDRRHTIIHTLADPSGRIPGSFQLRRCGGCGIVYTDPRPADEQLTELYDSAFYFSTGWAYTALAERVIAIIQSARRRRVEQLVPRGRLLDIGSGDGAFAHHMARHGWDATGVDFSPSAIAAARRTRSGARFVQGSLADAHWPARRFDAITLWQVLEHIGEPLPLLSECHRLLSPGGVLVAAVPNIDGWSARLTGARWWGLDVPRHLVHYSPRTLRTTLEWAGFRVERIRHRSLQYDPYALLHSTLDWAFTRRHFLSDLAKRQTAPDMTRLEYAYDVVALALLAPLLAPLSLAVTSVAAVYGRGGFIEVHARRE